VGTAGNTGERSRSMGDFAKFTLSRRAVLGAGAAAAGLLAMPAVLRAQDRSLKVGVYGGYFKDSFDKNIFPDFTKATGIAVESVAEPTGEAWLVQLEQASKAGQAPADLSMMSQTSTLKGEQTELWTPIDTAKIKNYDNLLERFVAKYPDGRVAGIGAVAWYITLVTNTDVYKEPPTTWAALWDPANADKLGLLALASNSFLLEVTAKTFMGGTNALDTEEGLLKAFEKLAEVKPNVRLWYRDEAQFEQALKSGEIPMGQYYHDVTGLAAADGQPVRSTFPKEGGIQDSGNWVLSRASKKGEEAHVFIDYMSQPQIQGLMSRKVGTAPTLKKEVLDLTPEEFAAVSSDIEPIIPRYDLYTTKSDWISQKWTELIVG
jgi:putative spermidine/putrescine transport system substrate-binding protein